MSKISQAIQDYETYRSTFSRGLLNAAAEQSLTGSIKLTDSKLSLPFISKEHFQLMLSQQERLKKAASKNKDKQLDVPTLLKRYPEAEDMVRVMEVIYHEVFHVLQKHAYRSVYSLVESLQSVEVFEHTLFFSHAAAGGTWKLGESFVSNLWALDDVTANNVASLLSQSCRDAMAAGEQREGLSLMHLIEGQTLIASRIATRTLDWLPMPESELYSKAWHRYQAASGTEPIVFVLVVGAALRYGDVEEDSFYPHPVDIFNYLLKFVGDIESLHTVLDRHSVNNDSAVDDFKQRCELLIKRVQKRNFDPAESGDTDFTYIRNDEHPLSDEIKDRYLTALYHHFDHETESDRPPGFGSSMEDQLTFSLLQVSKAISSIIEYSYTRVARPMDKNFSEAGDGGIAEAVGYYVARKVPDYYREKTMIRYFFDQTFVLGELFPYFLTRINEAVKVKPFSYVPEMSHLDYRSMALMPDLIKKLLYVYAWKQGDLPENESPMSAYCCALHGAPALEDANPDFYEKCLDEEAVGRALRIMFNRSVSDFFEL